MIEIDVISPKMEAHIHGCADVARKLQRHRASDENVQTYSGADLVAVVIDIDTDWADAFGEEPYTQSARDNGCWTMANMKLAPCITNLPEWKRLDYDGTSAPTARKETPVPSKKAAKVATTPAPTTRRVFAEGQCHHRDGDGRPDCDEQRGNKSQNLCPGHEAEWQAAAKARRAAKAAPDAAPAIDLGPVVEADGTPTEQTLAVLQDEAPKPKRSRKAKALPTTTEEFVADVKALLR